MNDKIIQPYQILTSWKTDLLQLLNNDGLDFKLKLHQRLSLIYYHDLVIHLVDVKNLLSSDELMEIQRVHNHKDVRLVHLWEDVWLTKPTQVMARIKSLLGLNIRIHGRKTKVILINKPLAERFLNENHLQGFVTSRHKFGLFLNDELMAVATFSALRKMNHSENYSSAELIRFAVKSGYSIVGGLSKLLKAFVNQFHPNDIMTYADRDWSGGEAYLKVGFNYIADLEPQKFTVDKHLVRKLIKNETMNNMAIVTNTGSLKFILPC